MKFNLSKLFNLSSANNYKIIDFKIVVKFIIKN